MPNLFSRVKRLASDAFDDLVHEEERSIPGVAALEDHFPKFTKQFKQDLRSGTRGVRRKLEREFRDDVKSFAPHAPHVHRAKKLEPSGKTAARVKRAQFEKKADTIRRDRNDRAKVSISNMPHGRTSLRRRGSVKSRSRNLQSQISMGRPMRAVAKRTQYAEVKYLTTLSSLVAPTVLQASSIPQGVQHLQRTGDDVRALDLNITYQIFKNTLSASADIDQWRFTVFQWHPNSSVAPTPADIFVDVPGSLPARQYFNLSRRPLYTVLYDASGTLTGTFAAPVTGQSVTGIVKASLKIPRGSLTYDPVATTGTNQIYIMFQSHNDVSDLNAPKGDLTWRLTYIDS